MKEPEGPRKDPTALAGPGVVYSSGLFIHDDSLISTLSVLYERVYLPSLLGKYPADPNEDKLYGTLDAEFENEPELEFDGSGPEFPDRELPEMLKNHPDLVEFYNAAALWKRPLSLLFSEGVLVRLPSYEESLFAGLSESEIDQYWDPYWDRFEVVLEDITRKKEPDRHANALQKAELAFAIDLTFHAVREDIRLPRIFDESQVLDRRALVVLEASAAFQYLLPRLNPLRPDEILELRRKVNDTREGFTMHLQKLSKGLDSILESGGKLQDVKRYAQNIVETELIPDYREFRRQLEAEQAGKVKKVLDVAGKIMEIDAAPCTPKFLVMFLKALGIAAIQTAADRKERLSNKYQAYEFMKTVEGK